MGLLIGENEEYDYYGLLSNFDIKVVPIKSLNDDTISGSVDNIVNAVKYAEAIKSDIVIMSFSTYTNSEELKAVIENTNMLFVVASGNDGRELTDDFKVFPACFDCNSIISVAALSQSGYIDNQSNYGKEYVDVAAPGDDIVCYLGDELFVLEGGTSFAVPFVAAEAAMIACVSEKKLTPEDIKSITVNSVDYNEIYDEKLKSSGSISMKKAIESLACGYSY